MYLQKTCTTDNRRQFQVEQGIILGLGLNGARTSGLTTGILLATMQVLRDYNYIFIRALYMEQASNESYAARLA